MNASAWYDSLTVGHEERTPEQALDDEVIQRAITLAGYRHPLFTDPGYAARTPFGATPLPGGVLLGFLGGLVEHCPMLSAAPTVLGGFESVRFHRPVLAGDTVAVRVQVAGKRVTTGGTRLIDLSWDARNQRNEVVATARASFVVTDEGANC